jgi:hypothetical protein
VTRDERPLSAVPAWLWVALVLALALQVAWHGPRGPAAAGTAGLPPPPGAAALRLASFGEPQALARIAMLYVQSRAHRELDYARLVGWLQAVLELDPRSDYPLFAAARIYAENPDPARARMALQFVHEAFLADPNRRWPALAHAALLAKHRLKDLPLARRYAAAIERHTTAREVPLWAKQMEIFILEDMDQLEAAKIMLGGLLQSGQIDDPAEARFLAQRLKELEARLAVESSTDMSAGRRPGSANRKN